MIRIIIGILLIFTLLILEVGAKLSGLTFWSNLHIFYTLGLYWYWRRKYFTGLASVLGIAFILTLLSGENFFTQAVLFFVVLLIWLLLERYLLVLQKQDEKIKLWLVQITFIIVVIVLNSGGNPEVSFLLAVILLLINTLVLLAINYFEPKIYPEKSNTISVR